MAKKAKMFKYLEIVSPLIPAPIYWLNTESVLLGANEAVLKLIGIEDPIEVIGKRAADVYTKEIADEIVKLDKEVISSGNTLSQVEPTMNVTTGEVKYVKTVKAPIYDENGIIIGIVGTSIDITAEKKLEQLHHENVSRLERENKTQQMLLEQEKKFKKIASQVAHDLGSPLAALQMVVQHCDSLPENNRKALNKSARRISDIAENFLSQFRSKDSGEEESTRQSTLISAEIMEVLTEKKYEYNDTSLDFIYKFTNAGYFAFINIDARAFKRTLSNLINNAVDACDSMVGEVSIRLDVFGNKVQIIIQDNGKGLEDAEKEAVLKNFAANSSKPGIYGISFDQIRETLINNEGTFNIESIKGLGTKILLTFPKIEAPQWIAEKIELHNNTIVVILDDDDSIHGAWEARFEKAAQHIGRKHFTHGIDAIKYINSLSAMQKERVLLLTDYELLRQNLQGLDVINQTGIKNSILVTSHHNNQEVRKLASQTNTKILPKPLASEISINISEISAPQVPGKVNLVFVYEDREFLGLFKRLMVKDDKVVDAYTTIDGFMNNISGYSKETNILVGNRFKDGSIMGVDVARQLHELGFNNLYLFSGRDYSGDSSIPGYLTPILKTDIKAVVQLLHS